MKKLKNETKVEQNLLCGIVKCICSFDLKVLLDTFVTDGLEEGQGEISYPNGNVLSGQFEDGKIHGHTVLRYANGDQREGFFRENELDGQV